MLLICMLCQLLLILKITVVNPAMDRALALLQKFAVDAQSGKISKDKLRFGAPWRHPPQTDDPTLCYEWAKIQLMDFVQSLINTEFGVCCLCFWLFYIRHYLLIFCSHFLIKSC